MSPRRLLTIVAMIAAGAAAFAGTAAQAPAPARPAGLPLSPGLERFTVLSDGHPLAVWARTPAQSKSAILLIHGRTWSSRPDFDLQVPGLHRSVMADLAAQGVAAYALDQRGYGETPRDSTGWLTPRKAAKDVANVLTWIANRHPALKKPMLLGWSRGAAVAHLAAELTPAEMSGVILFGYTIDPGDADIAATPDPDKPPMTPNAREDTLSDFITPAVTPVAMTRAFADTAIRTDPILVDWKSEAEFNPLKPQLIKIPTLVLQGENDPNVPMDIAAQFFAKLGASDKQWIVLPGADHCAQLEDTHDAWIAAVVNFINRPPLSRK